MPFYENRQAYLRCAWIGTGRGWVDPVKEAQAAELRMKIGVSTLRDECAEQGKPWREVIEQRARERKYQREVNKTHGLEDEEPSPGLPVVAEHPSDEEGGPPVPGKQVPQAA